MRIIIDIGHARNTGSRGLHNFNEHEYCSLLATPLAAALKADGHNVTVIDYPEASNRADLNATITAINEQRDIDLVISLHTNWAETHAREANLE